MSIDDEVIIVYILGMPKKTASRPPLKLRRQAKPQAHRREKREPRNVIISFRLRESEAKTLWADLKRFPIAGVKSLKQFSRKLTIDHARRRTVYVENIDRQIDPDAREKLKIEPPNCIMSDKPFIQALLAFLITEENWRKLRLFMLQAGWPQPLIDRYNNADNDQERLMAAQECLKQMLKK